jgi:hypothetical protein
VSGEQRTRVFYKTASLVIWLEYDNDSRLTFCGQDFGGWGGTSEYEYWISVHGDELRSALNADAGADLGDIVCARVDEIMACGESTWLTKHGVEYRLDTRYEFDDDEATSTD